MITILTQCIFQVNTVSGQYANIPSYRAFDLVDLGEEFAVHTKDEMHFGFDSRQDRQMILYAAASSSGSIYLPSILGTKVSYSSIHKSGVC